MFVLLEHSMKRWGMNDEHWTLKRKRICDIFSQRPSFIFLLLGGFLYQLSNGGEKELWHFAHSHTSHHSYFSYFCYSGDSLFIVKESMVFRGNSNVMTLFSREPTFKLFKFLLLCTKEWIPHCIMALFCSFNVIGENMGDELLLSLFSKRINKQSNRIVAFSVQEPITNHIVVMFCSFDVMGEILGDELLLSLFSKRI